MKISIGSLLLGLSLGSAAIAHAQVIGAPGGTGPLPAVVERVAALPQHTLYRPVKLPPTPLPVLVWGNGACRGNGLAYETFLKQIASQGYVVIAVGAPLASRDQELAQQAREANAAAPVPPQSVRQPTPDETQSAQLLEAIDWVVRENTREGSPLRGHISATKVAVAGHSCGGLQALAVSTDPRVRTTLVLNSGIYIRPGSGLSGVQLDKSHLARLHGPMLYLSGGPGDIAHVNALDDVSRINHVPVFHAWLPVGHSGTFNAPQLDGGDWAQVAARWLDWTLKGSADASWDFAGPACRLCVDDRWHITQKNIGLPTGPLRQSRYVTVRDGTRLAMHIYRPAVGGKPVETSMPVIFSFTPYRARFYGPSGDINELAQFGSFGVKDLTEKGYVIAIADIRGKGASFGARRGFQDRTEALDGYDLVQWLSRQPWGSDKVGMLGCSYLGGTTTQVASTAPPALKAIFTGATDLDKFAFVRRGGITAQFNTRPDEPLTDDLASVPVDEDPQGILMRAAVAQHAGNTPMAPLWYGMPYRDSLSALTGTRFWQEVALYGYLDTIRKAGIATYFWGNWQDEPTEQVMQWSANLKSKLIVGPGSHCVAPPDMDFAGEIRRYFDHHLQGKDTGLYREPRVRYWVDNSATGKAWQRSEQEPGVGVTRTRLYLGAGATLTASAPGRGAESFKVDYNVGPPEAFAFWITSQREHGLQYTGQPLQRDAVLEGAPLMDVWLSADRSEARVFAYLEDVAPDNSTQVVSFGRLLASQRKVVKPPYDTLGAPWQSGLRQDAQPLRAGEAVQLQFALTPTARVIKAGHRLRVVLTGADPRQRNLAELKEDPAPVLTLWRGKSSVELPLRAPGAHSP